MNFLDQWRVYSSGCCQKPQTMFRYKLLYSPTEPRFLLVVFIPCRLRFHEGEGETLLQTLHTNKMDSNCLLLSVTCYGGKSYGFVYKWITPRNNQSPYITDRVSAYVHTVSPSSVRNHKMSLITTLISSLFGFLNTCLFYIMILLPFLLVCVSKSLCPWNI